MKIMSIFLLFLTFFNYLSQSNTSTSVYFVNVPTKDNENPSIDPSISFAYVNFNDSKSLIQDQSTKLSEKISRTQQNKITISERMCTSFHNTTPAWQYVHTTRSQNISSKTHPLVTASVAASPNDFPNLAALGSLMDEKKFIFHCAGTLIDRKWILTAAHCTHFSSNKFTVARLGVDRLSQLNDGITIKIKKILRHPSYKAPQMYFDIALVGLDSFVEFSDSIAPACLDQDFGNIPDTAWISGWGSTEFAGQDNSDVLQKAEVQIIDNIWCSTKFTHTPAIPRGIAPSMICAGSPSDNWRRDTCQGDSGGALQVIVDSNTQRIFKIIGITSFGAACGLTESPGVYTRVSHFIPWIEHIVWPQDTF